MRDRAPTAATHAPRSTRRAPHRPCRHDPRPREPRHSRRRRQPKKQRADHRGPGASADRRERATCHSHRGLPNRAGRGGSPSIGRPRMPCRIDVRRVGQRSHGGAVPSGMLKRLNPSSRLPRMRSGPCGATQTKASSTRTFASEPGAVRTRPDEQHIGPQSRAGIAGRRTDGSGDARFGLQWPGPS
jgi:hypothetical protein